MLAVIMLALGAAACSDDRDTASSDAQVGQSSTAAPDATGTPVTTPPDTQPSATQAPATQAPATQAPVTVAAAPETTAEEATTVAADQPDSSAAASESDTSAAETSAPPETTVAVATSATATGAAVVSAAPDESAAPESAPPGTPGETQPAILAGDVGADAAEITAAESTAAAESPATAPSSAQPETTAAGAATETSADTSDVATTSGSSDTATTAAGSSEPATSAAAAPDGPTFGDMAWPCGPADGANTDDGDEPGVTAEQIAIGYGDDAGFEVVPGLNHEASDAINAMVARCNELGGINGRQIVANYYDSKLTQVNTAILAACRDEVFWLVGTAWAFDEQQEEIRQSCGLPASPTYTISGVFSNAPLMYQGNPNPIDEFPGGQLAIFAELFPEEVHSAGALSVNIGAALTARDKALAAAPAFGWEFVSTDLTSNPMGEQDWTPLVIQLRDAGVEAIYYSGQCLPMLGLFAETAAANEYQPVILGPGNLYEPSCVAEYPNLNNLYVDTVFVPMEEAQYNKATQDYLDLVVATEGDVALLGMQATSSFLLWAQAADACGTTLTRDCVLENMANTHEWTAGGLHAPSDPGSNHPATCSALFKSENGTYVRAYPEEPATFACGLEGAPEFLTPIEVPGLDAVQLDENRISRIYSAE